MRSEQECETSEALSTMSERLKQVVEVEHDEMVDIFGELEEANQRLQDQVDHQADKIVSIAKEQLEREKRERRDCQKGAPSARRMSAGFKRPHILSRTRRDKHNVGIRPQEGNKIVE